MIKDGISKEDFVKVQGFVPKYVNVLTKSKSAELGYAIDSLYYGIPNYNEYIKNAVAKLTVDDVNRAIQKHLRALNMQVVGIAKDAAGVKAALTSDAATPPHYNSPKPKEVLDEDKIIETWPLYLKTEDVTIVPVAKVFEN